MKQLNINCPEGYEIDQDKSDLSKGIVHFKEINKVECYDSIATKLFNNKIVYYIDNDGSIEISELFSSISDSNNSISEEQLESILALNKLCNVAKYLNGDWLPTFDNYTTIHYITLKKGIQPVSMNSLGGNHWGHDVYFKSQDLANQAIKILGEEEIRKALILNH